MAYRTDLALESLPAGEGQLPAGVVMRRTQKPGANIAHLHIQTPEAARQMGKAPGRYITLEMDSLAACTVDITQAAQAVAGALAPLLPEGEVLVVGLGNRSITPDALGPACAGQILATRHLPPGQARQLGLGPLRPVAAIAPGVMGQTGVESSEVVGALAARLHPAAVVAVDALASCSVARLGCTVQLSDTGIAPGAGVLNRRKELSRATLGIPVIAVGVPTVVDGATLARELAGQPEGPGQAPSGGRPVMVTPRDIDLLIEKGAALLALGINLALQPGLSAEDLLALTREP